MEFKSPLVKARLIRRYKRFLADVELDDQRVVTAHCANPGSMMGLKEPESEVWLSPADNPKRKLQWNWELVRAGGTLVGINTAYPNAIVTEAVKADQIPELTGYDSLKREVRYGQNSRIDLLLQGKDRPDCYVEIKSVTLSREKGLAEFPDARTARGTKHLEELQTMVSDSHRAVMLFLVQRMDCTRFSPAADIDPVYIQALLNAQDAGVELLCYDCALSPQAITLRQVVEITLQNPDTLQT